MASLRNVRWVICVALGCGARSPLDSSQLDQGASGASSTGGVPSRGGSGAMAVGGSASGGVLTGGMAAGGAVPPGTGGALPGGAGGVTVAGAGGTAGSADAGAAGDDGAGGESPERRVVEVVAGAFHSCARFDDGTLRCFGSGLHAGLGLGKQAMIGDDEPASSVADVEIGHPVRQLSASWYHTCVILVGGRLRCFGNAGSGYLGYGNADDIGDDETPASAGDVDAGGLALHVATGPDHTCVVLRHGDVRCWGKNQYHQLGYASVDTIGDDEAPASAPYVDIGAKAKQVACGFSHSCALLESGRVRCWGTGNGGQLGYGVDGVIGDDESPADVGDVDLGGKASQISAGAFHTCALLDSGRVRCWGRGYYGALGYGNTRNIGDDETPASAGDVDLGEKAVQIEAGDYATCAVLASGAVRCWGDAEQGELGRGDGEMIGDDELPSDVPVVAVGAPVKQLNVGFLHVCATTAAGNARCWGRAGTGALGYGNTNNVGDDEQPVVVGDVPLR